MKNALERAMKKG